MKKWRLNPREYCTTMYCKDCIYKELKRCPMEIIKRTEKIIDAMTSKINKKKQLKNE